VGELAVLAMLWVAPHAVGLLLLRLLLQKLVLLLVICGRVVAGWWLSQKL
jgi:hypothetical protein